MLLHCEGMKGQTHKAWLKFKQWALCSVFLRLRYKYYLHVHKKHWYSSVLWLVPADRFITLQTSEDVEGHMSTFLHLLHAPKISLQGCDRTQTPLSKASSYILFYGTLTNHVECIKMCKRGKKKWEEWRVGVSLIMSWTVIERILALHSRYYLRQTLYILYILTKLMSFFILFYWWFSFVIQTINGTKIKLSQKNLLYFASKSHKPSS